jgi:anti-sigma-K factor RskA
MSVRDHALIEELLAVRALDGLDGEDAAVLEAAMAAHGAECEECRRLEVGFTETAAMLAFGLEPAPVPEDLADRIVAAGSASIPAGSDASAGRAGSARAWAAVLAVAAAFALVAVLFVVVSPGPGSARTASTVVRFKGGEGELAMAYTPGETGAVFWGQDLPDPGPGKVYEIWMIRTDEAPVSGACVTPTDGHLAAVVDANVSTSNVMAVTVETTACPSAPTTAPVYTAPIA